MGTGRESTPTVQPWPQWDELLPALVCLDDPESLEALKGFNFFAERRRFADLARRMEGVFGPVEVDWSAQDSSHHGSITLSADVLRSGDAITVVISNFGNLAAVSLGVPDSHDSEEISILMDVAERDLIGELVVSAGYIPVAEDLLRERYTGVSVFARDPQRPPSWWDRFFTYL